MNVSMLEVIEPTTVSNDNKFSFSEEDFCHILVGNDREAYCGYLHNPAQTRCDDYKGEAICSTCGLPTCPICSTMEELELNLLD